MQIEIVEINFEVEEIKFEEEEMKFVEFLIIDVGEEFIVIDEMQVVDEKVIEEI